MSRLFATILVLSIFSAGVTSAEDAESEAADDNEITLSDLFLAPEIEGIELSPSAEFVAYRKDQGIWVGNADVEYQRIYKFRSDELIGTFKWVGDNALVVQTINTTNRNRSLFSSKVKIDDDGEIVVIDKKQHSADGYIYDPQLDDPDKVIFARVRRDEEIVAADLFTINVFEQSKWLFKGREEIDTGSDDYYHYVRDSNDNYVVGVLFKHGVPEIWRRSVDGNDWTLLWAAKKEAEYRPFSISTDGQSLFALSNAFTDKIAAIEVNLNDGSLLRVLYEHERYDLNNLLIDDDPVPYAAVYADQGMFRYRFFSDDARGEYQQLQDIFPDKGILLAGRSRDGNVQLVHTLTPTSRGQIQRCDLNKNTCELLFTLAPWLDDKELSDTIVIEVESDDGVTIEAFLTLPLAGGDEIPLVVMPHGGPIGVSDSRHFSADVQWLAHNGYAVLQVNYRGSGGYGKEFESAGLREWGRGIEDDIDSAVLGALESHPQLDRDRVGAIGSSYGGYSALMSVIRNPDIYKCAASFAGVTDLTLMFSQSKMHKNPELRKAMERIIGHPDLDYEEQRANSPVYRYKEIQRPILLAHGTKDRVVDIEHSWRLRMLMRLNGADPEFVILKDVGHGFPYVEQARSFYEPLLAFLDEHLKP